MDYRYQFIQDMRSGEDKISREAADPSMILFQGKYYIFASMTLSVWVSEDMVHWESHRLPDSLPLYDYAPDVRVVGDYVYFSASRRGTICDFYRTKDILNGPFERIPGTFDFWDPNLFLDDDGKLYFYWGCNNVTPIWGVELEPETMYRGIKVLGRINNLSVILPENKLDEIAITLGLNEYFRLEEIVAMCEKSGVHTQFVPDYHNIIPTKPYTEDLQGLPVVNIRYVPLSNTFNAMLKRIVDIFGALVAIILFSPVMLFSCIMIKLTSPGPLIYRHTRVGLHNKPFEMYKFRSMEVQTEEKEKKAWTVKNDPRVTGFGKFMRHTSIDELPQLFNILKGDMSLVGPRPERPFFVEKFREEIPRYMVKHQVRPGLTGWAQVNGYRGDTSIRKRIDCDLYYIENWTLGLDFKILFLTFFKGFVNKNAY